MATREVTTGKSFSQTRKKRVARGDLGNPPPKRLKSLALGGAKAPTKIAHRPLRVSTADPVLNNAPTARLEIFVFGDGSSGELGQGTKNAIDVTTPRLNPNLDAKSVGVVDLATGGMHSVALTYDNKVLTWGVNDLSTLGRDTTWEGRMRDANADDDSDSDGSDSDLNPLESTPAVIPTEKFPAGVKIVQVAAGDSASFVLTDKGFVYGWGTFRNSSGIFGFSLQPDNKVIRVQHEPTLIPNLRKITQLSAGNDFCLALDVDGNVFGWGNGEQSQIGRRLLERRVNSALFPTRIALPKKKIVSIHASADHAFAIDSNGDSWAWGSNNFAQTGINEDAGVFGGHITAPKKVKSLQGKNMKIVKGGNHHSIGITHRGECLVWGRIDSAQMGLGVSKLPLNEPEKVIVDRGKPRILLQPTHVPIPTCTFAAAGPDHNIVITSDGRAYSWGFNVNYQCGQGTDDDIQIATLMNDPAIRDKRLYWAGAGGQYSMLASHYRDVKKANAKSLVNGIS